jgi:hypothetical protein
MRELLIAGWNTQKKHKYLCGILRVSEKGTSPVSDGVVATIKIRSRIASGEPTPQLHQPLKSSEMASHRSRREPLLAEIRAFHTPTLRPAMRVLVERHGAIEVAFL